MFIENTGVRALKFNDFKRIISRCINWFKYSRGFKKSSKLINVLSPLVIPLPFSKIAIILNTLILKNSINNYLKYRKIKEYALITFLHSPLVLNLINNNYEISLLIDNQKNHADSHSVFVVDKFVKSVRSKSEKCNSQFVGIVKFSKNGSIALNKILDNFHKQNNLDGEIIRIFEKLIDDSFPLHACFTNNQKWFNVNDLSQLESSRDFFGP